MASVKRQPNGRFQLTVKRKAIREKPWYFNFDTREEAEEYGRRLEALLDGGVVPPELVEGAKAYETLNDLFRAYLTDTHVATGDKGNIGVMTGRIGDTRLSKINYRWAEEWVTSMKREHNLGPSTIRHYVGALKRCFDWAVRRGIVELATNPLHLLPRGYSVYTPADVQFVEAHEGKEIKEATERDRRLNSGEEEAIRRIMNREKPKGRERPLEMKYQAALICMFDLAVETAMRLREIYRLEVEVVDLEEATVFLKKTKTTQRMRRTRQVPLSTDAVRSLKTYMDHVRNQTGGMEGFHFDNGALFPWWDGKSWGENDKENHYLRYLTTELSAQFARIFDAAGCPDLVFHDLRHEATSRLFERTTLQDFEIMKITGHSSIKMLARYANLRGSNLAKRLW